MEDNATIISRRMSDSGNATESSGSEWEGWVDDAEDSKCFFCAKEIPGIPETLDHVKENHKFDFLKQKQDLDLDEYGTMKLINFLRKNHGEDNDTMIYNLPADFLELIIKDEYLQPVLANDPLLYYDYDVEIEKNESKLSKEDEEILKLRNIIEEQAKELSKLKEINQKVTERAQHYIMNLEEKVAKESPKEDTDVSYKECYSSYAIHETMLRDRVRTESYRDSILKNKAFFKDKIVVDVGCGTGILSLICAEAGAKHVYGIDFSETAKAAQKTVIENKMEDKVTIIQGKVEEVELPIDKADIIISEWMGYFLLYESMLETVLNARDRWLKPDGVVLPDQSSMHLVALEYVCKVEFWNEVYGYKMNSMKDQFYNTAVVATENPKHMMSDRAVIHNVNITKMSTRETSFVNNFRLNCSRSGTCRGFLVYFDIVFDADMGTQVYFSTGPDVTSTHWEQTVFALKEPVEVEKDDVIVGTMSCSHHIEYKRGCDIFLEYYIESSTGERKTKKITQPFQLM